MSKLLAIRPDLIPDLETTNWQLDSIVAELKSKRRAWRAEQQRPHYFGGRNLPSRDAVQSIVKALGQALFPMRLGPIDLHQEAEDYYVGLQLDSALNALYTQARLELAYDAHLAQIAQGTLAPIQRDQQAQEIVQTFASTLPRIRQDLDADVLAAFHSDPAARSVDEVLMCYPGIKAMIFHRIAHEWYVLGLPLLARMLTELSHSETGIDIHPGATIASGFFIDHGTGVVIGETTTIGKNVRLYQAVTLGAKRFEKNEDGTLAKDYVRHPTVEDEVVIYAGATILGNITIGRGSVIGGNVWLTHSVPPHSHISQEHSSRI
ncbi:MAG: serine acetyltransferase [Thiothrix sp.]|nr:MAG: serine acetyltransferase [Thiothrix sp.]